MHGVTGTSTPTISLQLYSVRDALEADLDGTLARVAEIGFTTVESFDFVARAPSWAEALRRHGLRAATGHAFLASTTIAAPDGRVVEVPSHGTVLDAAAELGIDVVIDPYSEPSRWTTRAAIEATASRLNEAVEPAATRGMRVGYHNHAQEFGVIDGRFGIEVFADALDPRVVLEIDLYWATVGGCDDLPALLARLGERVIAVHVKDGTLEADKTSAHPPTDQVPPGAGRVPLDAALDAAAALEYAVVEYDHYVGGDVIDAVAAGYAFLAARQS